MCDPAGAIYVAGLVRCLFWPEGQICDAISMLGSFPINLQGGYSDVFVARLFDPSAVVVQLKIARTASGLSLSWPATFSNMVLENAELLPTPIWTALSQAPMVEGDQMVVSVKVTSEARFFRLRKP